MLRSRVLTAGLLSLSLCTCAAAQGANSDSELLARARGLLSAEELRGNCSSLTVTIKAHIDRLREFKKKAKTEQEGPPPSLFGGRPAVADSKKERLRVEALNAVLDAKGCKPVNIDEELSKVQPATEKQSPRPARKSP
jgi:hypothetical protein